MLHTGRRAMRRTSTAVVAVLLSVGLTAGAMTSAAYAASSAKPATPPPNTALVIIGDSITAFGNDTVGADRRGWWSLLGAALNVPVVRYAERGSGYAKRGKNLDGTGSCTGTTFLERLARKDVATSVKQARIVLVEGGVNDQRSCSTQSTGTLVQTTADEVRAQVHRTLRKIAQLRGKRRSSVYVTAPWGSSTSVASAREWVVPIIEAEAKRYGFRYVDTAHGTLEGPRTNDGIHPNVAGKRRMVQDLIGRSDLGRWGIDRQYLGAVGATTSNTPHAAR